MFELSESECNGLINSLRSQFVISNERAGRRYAPFAFTEEGVAKLFGVLRSPVVVQTNMNVAIMRAFVAMRNYVLNQAASSAELAQLWECVLSLEQAVRDHSEAFRRYEKGYRYAL